MVRFERGVTSHKRAHIVVIVTNPQFPKPSPYSWQNLAVQTHVLQTSRISRINIV